MIDRILARIEALESAHDVDGLTRLSRQLEHLAQAADRKRRLVSTDDAAARQTQSERYAEQVDQARALDA